MTTTDELRPRCVGTTKNTFCKTIAECHAGTDGARVGDEGLDSNRFCQAQFSADGTTIITRNADHCMRTFVLPVDLLNDTAQTHTLAAHCMSQAPTPIQTFACYPGFDLQDASTTVYLSSTRNLPISLNNVFYNEFKHAKYPFINATTEEYISPSSLAWTRDGSRFVAGSLNRISVFDAAVDGSGPISEHKTAAGRKEKKLYGAEGKRGCRGIVSALSMSSDGILAAGTLDRQIGLYANQGSGECVTAFSIADTFDSPISLRGVGITHLAWSSDGKYLLAAERRSDVIQVYDVRNTMQRVAWLSGRKADTMQKLGIDVVPTVSGYEAWAGGTDGCVRMWKYAGSIEGDHAPDGEFKAHNDPVAGAVWHPTGAVLATCSGRKDLEPMGSEVKIDGGNASLGESEMESFDNTLRLWTV